MKINYKIGIYFAAIIVSCICLNGWIWFYYQTKVLLPAISIFCTGIAGLSAVLIFVLKRHMEQTIAQLSRVIASITDMNGNEVFSVLDDDLLSKLQSQVIKLTNILRAQNVKIKRERDEIKSLISDISHQLKTPLSNLKLYHELSQAPLISTEEYNEFSSNIHSQIDKLSFLLESIIKLSRLEGGIIQLVPSKISLNNICLTAIKQAYQKARSKRIEITFNPGKDITLNLDKNWTVEAVFNLIDNAVKYTGPGGTVAVDTVQYELFARLDIVDSGIGIDEEEINHIFKRFYRGRHAQNEEGVGLGLYLAREIIQKQNGYIKVKSTPQEGSTFSVFLPLIGV